MKGAKQTGIDSDAHEKSGIVTSIAVRAMVDAVEICGLIAVLEAGNGNGITEKINEARAGRAAGHIQRSLFTRMHIVVARAYAPARKGDLHARHAFEMVKNQKIRAWFIVDGEFEDRLKNAEKLWDDCCASPAYEPFMQYRHKQLAHLATLDSQTRDPLYGEVLKFSRQTADALAELASATGVFNCGLDTQIPAHEESAKIFWEVWKNNKTQQNYAFFLNT